MYLQHFWSSGKLFVFLSTKLRQACQKLIVHVQTNILGRNHFVWKEHKFFILSGIRAKTFQSFDDKFFTGWSQMDSTCAEAQFEEKEFSFQKIHNISLPFLESQWQICGFLVFWRTIFRRVVKIAFSVVRESFLMKTIFDKKTVTPSYLDYGKLFRLFGDKFTAVLSKFLCTCSDEHFEEK